MRISRSIALLMAVLSLTALSLAACGDDDDASDGATAETTEEQTADEGTSDADSGGADPDDAVGGEPRDRVAELTIGVFEESGADFDEGCIRDIVSQLSDEDAEKMVAGGVDNDPDLSDEGEALSQELLSCLNQG